MNFYKGFLFILLVPPRNFVLEFLIFGLIGCLFMYFVFRLTAKRSNVDVTYVGERFLEILEKKRGHATNVKNGRKKRINVPPGRGITVDDLLVEENVQDVDALNVNESPVKRPRGRPRKKPEEVSDDESSDSESNENNSSSEDDESSHVKRPRGRPRKKPEEVSDDESSDSESNENNSSSKEESSSEDDSVCVSDTRVSAEDSEGENISKTEAPPFNKYCIGDYVIVFYTGSGQYYPGKITRISPVSATVECMERIGNSWRGYSQIAAEGRGNRALCGPRKNVLGTDCGPIKHPSCGPYKVKSCKHYNFPILSTSLIIIICISTFEPVMRI